MSFYHIQSVSADTTVSTGVDVYFMDASGGSFVMTMPDMTGVADSQGWMLSRIDTNGANIITVKDNGGTTIVVIGVNQGVNLAWVDSTWEFINDVIAYSGYSGYSGFSGLSGYSGYSGMSGYSGYSGQSGYSGFSSLSGYSGFSSLSGYSGFSSLSGYSGYSGISGYSGYSGISGYSGFSGKSGYSGFSGISGYSGFSGKSGYSGFSGISGYSGFSGAASDVRLKTNIKPFTKGLEIVKRINPVYYNWKGIYVGHSTEEQEIGIIGQELESFLPQAISKTYQVIQTGGRKTDIIHNWKSTPVVMALVNAVKELNIEIEKLKQEINNLKK